ncbi:MlaD family protein [Silvimonas amylolytica]|uniref:Mce related protein n=1 Tax=Silvimonas amylolytica TaxID=449663 RepID=A0ABQ2PG02_9NEIS|nr:MlaD family protein [Silvimonas amylolytica]GGP24507.1 mce related protein [Silvimonas amylolytica]
MPIKYLKDTDARFQWLGWRVGVFIAAGFLCFVALVVLLAIRQGYFTPKTRLSFVAESGNSMSTGMQVRFSGFKIGVVDRVALNDQAKVDVELLVENRYLKWVKPDSVALLQQDGFLGDHYIEIAGGTATALPIQEGGKLVFAPAMGLSEIAADLRQRTIPVIDSIHDTLEYLNDPKGDVRATVANLNQFSAELRDTRKTLDQVLQHLDQVAAKDLPATLDQATQAARRADQVLAQADRAASEVATHLPVILENTSRTASEAAALATTARKAVDGVAPQLPSIVRNTGDLVQGGNELVTGAQRSWPFRNWVSAPDASAPVPESRGE